MNDLQILRQLRRIIGGNIHQRRLEKRVTLRRLARLTRITANRLDQFELGKSDIRLDELCRIATQLKIEAQALLTTKT